MKPCPVSLDRYLLRPEELQLPLDAHAIFEREAPLAVEVGFGGGEYLGWWAQQHPEWNFIGIELPPDCIFRAARLLHDADVPNVKLIRGDARYLLRELFPPASLDHVLMQFPMPWPKDKHAKHRVYSPAFAATLADVLKPGAPFELVTDQDWYGRETAEVFSARLDFQASALEVDPERPFRTRYERKWLEEGRSIYRFLARLEQPASAPRILFPEAMECHAIDPIPDAEAVRALLGRRFKEGESVAEVKEVMQTADGWLLRILSSDASFSQLFHVRIRNKEDGRCLLKIDEVPRPYYTEAVRFGLRSIAGCFAYQSR